MDSICVIMNIILYVWPLSYSLLYVWPVNLYRAISIKHQGTNIRHFHIIILMHAQSQLHLSTHTNDGGSTHHIVCNYIHQLRQATCMWCQLELGAWASTYVHSKLHANYASRLSSYLILVSMFSFEGSYWNY